MTFSTIPCRIEKNGLKHSPYAPVAQGIERSAPDRKAAGSNPVGCSEEALIFQGFFFYVIRFNAMPA